MASSGVAVKDFWSCHGSSIRIVYVVRSCQSHSMVSNRKYESLQIQSTTVFPSRSTLGMQGRSLVVSSLPGNPPWLPDSAYLAVIDGQQN